MACFKRAMKTAIAPCESDPRGNRCVEDFANHAMCPIDILYNGKVVNDDGSIDPSYGDFKKHMEDIRKELDIELELLATVQEDFKSEKQTASPRVTATAVEEHISKLAKLLGIGMPVKQQLLEMKARNPEDFEVAERAIIYSRILDTLKKKSALNRISTYSRVVDPALHKTPPRVQACYIILPGLLFAFAFTVQSFFLHIATHFYVYYMDEGDDHRREAGGQLFDVVGNFVGQVLAGTNSTGQGAVIEGDVPIPTILLDASGAIPLGLCVTAYGIAFFTEGFNIGLWNKTFLIASIMAVLKGTFDAVTVLPDSIGWDSCQERLGKTGLAQMRALAWMADFWDTLFTALTLEVVGINGQRVRYCADMMISGHTYFATLFSMSAFSQVNYATHLIPRKNYINRIVRYTVLVVCFSCVIVEVCLVAAARFHYTVDMLAAIVMVLFLWDSSTVEQIAADWSEGFHWRCEETWQTKPWMSSWWSMQHEKH